MIKDKWMFHIFNMEGLSNYLAGQIKLDDAIFDSSIENVDVITRGKTPPNPAELLEHSRLDELIVQCNKK